MVKQLNTNKNMKTRILLLMLSAWLLTGTMLFAQNSGTQKGDVNHDGVINEQDVPALIKIMRDGGGVRKPTTYYWYVGQTDPSTMTEISPIVTDKTSPGWRLIGTELPNYSSSNKLWDDSISDISLGSRNYWYVAIPNNSSAIVRDGLGNDGTTVDICTKQSNVTINGIEYKIFKSDQNYRSFQYPIY